MTKSVNTPPNVDNDSADVDALLTGGYLTGADYDAIGARVLDRVAPVRRARWGRWAAASVGGLSVAAALVLLFARPDGFRAKGTKLPMTGPVEVACNGLSETQCHRGDTLLFVVREPSAGYLGAYAERIDDPAHSRIWYFPARDGRTVRVGGDGEGRAVVSEGIRIGPEHAPGRYRVSAWLGEKPFKREELAPTTGEPPPGASVREIEVVP